MVLEGLFIRGLITKVWKWCRRTKELVPKGKGREKLPETGRKDSFGEHLLWEQRWPLSRDKSSLDAMSWGEYPNFSPFLYSSVRLNLTKPIWCSPNRQTFRGSKQGGERWEILIEGQLENMFSLLFCPLSSLVLNIGEISCPQHKRCPESQQLFYHYGVITICSYFRLKPKGLGIISILI